ncbi:PrsW family glutamic-type intramembrane protease [Nitrobacter sp. NHB1]|uniref:PrsW family glutamic-type intramembrane protease n=1 Tax=Nitrobacter sp. NHB1 TaxID=3119830 RepID=UPI003000CA0E
MHLLETFPTVIGAAAIAPALLLLWLVIAADERPGPPAMVWAAFVLGAVSISLLGFARVPFAPMLKVPEPPWLALMLKSVFGIAAPEELVKIAAIAAVTAMRRKSSDPMDAVVYGAAAGLGFAAYENLAYLMQHTDIWRSLAVLRSVLTVPFHGALGIIAGAYIAMARSGTALGAHRRARDWARIRNSVAVFAVPIALHASFDAPLLALQQNPDLGRSHAFVLEAVAMLVGFGAILFAAYLVRRVGAHHAPRSETSRERLRNLRGMWALLLAGGGASFLGAAFILSSIHRWITNADKHIHIATYLVPVGIVAIVIGIWLLVMTSAVYVLGRNRLQMTGTSPVSDLDQDGPPAGSEKRH